MDTKNTKNILYVAIVGMVAIVAIIGLIVGTGSTTMSNNQQESRNLVGEGGFTLFSSKDSRSTTSFLDTVYLTQEDFAGSVASFCESPGIQYRLVEDVDYSGVIIIGPGCFFHGQNNNLNSVNPANPSQAFIQTESSISSLNIVSSSPKVIELLNGADASWIYILGGEDFGIRAMGSSDISHVEVVNAGTAFHVASSAYIDDSIAQISNIGFQVGANAMIESSESINSNLGFFLMGDATGSRLNAEIEEYQMGYKVNRNAYLENSFCTSDSKESTICVQANGNANLQTVIVSGADTGFKVAYSSQSNNVYMNYVRSTDHTVGIDVEYNAHVTLERAQATQGDIGLRVDGTGSAEIIGGSASFLCDNQQYGFMTDTSDALLINGAVLRSDSHSGGYTLSNGGTLTSCPTGGGSTLKTVNSTAYLR